jgi:hypothetical protein
MKKTIVKATMYVDELFSAYILKIRTELLASQSLSGEQHGKLNKPTTALEYRAYSLNHIEAVIQSAIYKTKETFLPVSGVVVAQKARSIGEEKISLLTRERFDTEHLIQKLKERITRIGKNLPSKAKQALVLALLVVLGAADGYGSYAGFRLYGFPTPLALISCTGIVVAVTAGGHFLGRYIRFASNETIKYLRYIGTLALYGLGFIFLGFLRALAYGHIVHFTDSPGYAPIDDVPQLSGWIIAIVSFLLFWSGLFLSIHTAISKEDTQRQKEVAEATEDLQAVEEKVANIDAEIEKTRTSTLADEALALTKFEYARYCEEQLIATAFEAANAYNQKNLRFRSDNLCPTFFSEKPSFSFQCFFNPKNEVYEQD